MDKLLYTCPAQGTSLLLGSASGLIPSPAEFERQIKGMMHKVPQNAEPLGAIGSPLFTRNMMQHLLSQEEVHSDCFSFVLRQKEEALKVQTDVQLKQLSQHSRSDRQAREQDLAELLKREMAGIKDVEKSIQLARNNRQLLLQSLNATQTVQDESRQPKFMPKCITPVEKSVLEASAMTNKDKVPPPPGVAAARPKIQSFQQLTKSGLWLKLVDEAVAVLQEGARRIFLPEDKTKERRPQDKTKEGRPQDQAKDGRPDVKTKDGRPQDKAEEGCLENQPKQGRPQDKTEDGRPDVKTKEGAPVGVDAQEMQNKDKAEGQHKTNASVKKSKGKKKAAALNSGVPSLKV